MNKRHLRATKNRRSKGAAGGSGKLLFLGLVLALGAFPCVGQTSAGALWSFSAGTGLDLRYGIAHEYVYDNGRLLSQLDWDIKPMTAISSVARVRTGSSVFALSCAAGFPGTSGIVTDSDWQNEGTSNTNWKTNYSESTAVAERLVDFTLSYGYVFKLSRSIEFTTFLGYRSLDIEWSAHDGWLQYSTATGVPYTPYTTGTVSYLYGLLSTYSQSYSALLVGAKADWQLSESLSLTASLQGAPLVSCTAVDNHILRGLTFTDSLSGGFLLEPELGLLWSPVARMAIRLDLRYTLISGLHGDESVTAGSNVGSSEGLSPGQSATFLDAGGAGLSVFGLGLTADLHI